MSIPLVKRMKGFLGTSLDSSIDELEESYPQSEAPIDDRTEADDSLQAESKSFKSMPPCQGVITGGKTE